MISHTENRDCMEAMREFPDGFFDLAVVDPPFGAGFTEGGGCQGWFAKYHQNSPAERERETAQAITVLETPDHDLRNTSVTRTGGTWAEKYGKKS